MKLLRVKPSVLDAAYAAMGIDRAAAAATASAGSWGDIPQSGLGRPEGGGHGHKRGRPVTKVPKRGYHWKSKG